MPTGTSTILGAFQVIPSSQEIRRELTPKLNLGPRSTPRKCGTSNPAHLRVRSDGGYFSLGQSDFALGQNSAAVHQLEGRLSSAFQIHTPPVNVIRIVDRTPFRLLKVAGPVRSRI
jgi:hypothetical protein